MAAGMVQNKLKEFDGKKFGLMDFALGEVVLRDIKIQTTPVIQATADFGGY
jgi:hypothetical protein